MTLAACRRNAAAPPACRRRLCLYCPDWVPQNGGLAPNASVVFGLVLRGSDQATYEVLL